MRSCLEKRAMEERFYELQENCYNRYYEYNSYHQNAISDGDVKGKGTNSGGHGFYPPNCEADHVIDRSNFDTENGGGLYDIEGYQGAGSSGGDGRTVQLQRNMYGINEPYCLEKVNQSTEMANIQ